MAKRVDPLTPSGVANAKPQAKPYKMADGGGLFLLVQPTGAKWWRLKYRRPETPTTCRSASVTQYPGNRATARFFFGHTSRKAPRTPPDISGRDVRSRCGYPDLDPASDPPPVLRARTSDRVETCSPRSSSHHEEAKTNLGILVVRTIARPTRSSGYLNGNKQKARVEDVRLPGRLCRRTERRD
ncbi:Arm DNA-binding domain-containing protein [Rhodanobacter terrae]|uniref:Arm DNA-binding domain-containing protein n=1 Tax=Rhodanobacter terrae TaxID=418647 RepID=A0ABW0SSH6_9GAMM